MTTVKCYKHKCYYNVDNVCTHRKIKLWHNRCMNYTLDKDKSFTVKDLVHIKTTCHKESGKFKSNSKKIYK